MMYLKYVLSVAYFSLLYAPDIFAENPGIKALRQCYKYYDLKLSLREVDSYPLLTQEEVAKIREVEESVLDPAAGFVFIEAVGGVDAREKQFPFMAALGYGDGDDREYVCGGSLISDQYVLTAAHCIFSTIKGVVKSVRLGDLNIVSTEDDGTVQEFNVSNYTIHPNYTFPVQYHDIALVKLDGRINFTDYVKPICLEHERRILTDFLLDATGWGALGYGERRSDILQVVMLKYYKVSNCTTTYKSDQRRLPNGIMDDVQICAGTARRKISDTCEGDSGGPLLYSSDINGPNIHYLTGITSFGVQCGLSTLPAVYTRVSFYLKWIEDIVWPGKI